MREHESRISEKRKSIILQSALETSDPIESARKLRVLVPALTARLIGGVNVTVRELQTYCVGIKSNAGSSSDSNFVTSVSETKTQLAQGVPSLQKCLSWMKDRFKNIVGFGLSVTRGSV